MFNLIKGYFCKLPKHDPIIRFRGICKVGYFCSECGYEWYEKYDTKSTTNLKEGENDGK